MQSGGSQVAEGKVGPRDPEQSNTYLILPLVLSSVSRTYTRKSLKAFSRLEHREWKHLGNGRKVCTSMQLGEK